MKNVLSRLLTLVLLVSLLPACGGGGEAPADTAEPAGVTADDAPQDAVGDEETGAESDEGGEGMPAGNDSMDEESPEEDEDVPTDEDDGGGGG